MKGIKKIEENRGIWLVFETSSITVVKRDFASNFISVSYLYVGKE